MAHVSNSLQQLDPRGYQDSDSVCFKTEYDMEDCLMNMKTDGHESMIHGTHSDSATMAASGALSHDAVRRSNIVTLPYSTESVSHGSALVNSALTTRNINLELRPLDDCEIAIFVGACEYGQQERHQRMKNLQAKLVQCTIFGKTANSKLITEPCLSRRLRHTQFDQAIGMDPCTLDFRAIYFQYCSLVRKSVCIQCLSTAA